MAYLNIIETYLPKNKLLNKELAVRFPAWNAEKIYEKTGIKSRSIATNEETALDLAFEACLKLVQRIDKSKVDFLILCTQSPDYFLPTSACILQHKLGLSTNCGALDFNLGCSGYIYGLSLAKGLICANIAKNIILVTAETYSKYIHENDKSNLTIFGDGATASYISKEAVEHSYGRIGAFSLGTNGAGFDKLIVKSGGLRKRKADEEITYDRYDNPISDSHLYMNGRDVFSFTLKTVPKLIKDTLIKNRLSKEDINQYIFHQANKFMLEKLRKKIDIPTDKFFTNLASYGNTVSSTIPLALKEAQHTLKLQRTLLAGFGVGLSWGGCVLLNDL